MLHRASIAALAWLVLGGCTDAGSDPDTATAEQGVAACSYAVPAPTLWVAARSSPAQLFPAGVAHLHTFVAPADSTSFYAWGIANGEVLWLYRVPTTEGQGFFAALGMAWMEAEATPGASHSIVGHTKGEIPPPPTPPGQPLFTEAYVQRVFASAQQHQDATEYEIQKLGAM